jgi:thiosulfate/3-mercaptopyruvate sulfurtransferase
MTSPLVTADELLRDDKDAFRFVDGSWFLGEPGQGERSFALEHIPGAVHFPLDEVCDHESDLPHMLPSTEVFAAWAGRNGLTENDRIIVYDVQGVSSSPRVWWTFLVFAAADVRVLNGGLPAWKAAGGEVTNVTSAPEPRAFNASLRSGLVADLGWMQQCSEGSGLILDARSRGRFSGEDPEPRAGLPSGHMPNSANVPFTDLLEGGKMKPPAALHRRFAEAGVTEDRRIVTSCGSGVTAAVLALGLVEAGFPMPKLYDGSWAEWASAPGNTILRH